MEKFKKRQLIWTMSTTGFFTIYGLIVLPRFWGGYDEFDFNVFPLLLIISGILGLSAARLTEDQKYPLRVIFGWLLLILGLSSIMTIFTISGFKFGF